MTLLVTRGPSIDDIFWAIARGAVPGWRTVLKSGYNDDIDTGPDPEDIWQGSSLWVPPTAARIHDLVSTSGDDAAAGTGARQVLVDGLDAAFLPIAEVVTLNGVGAIPTVNAYTRINRLTVAAAGSGQTNAGAISATAQVDGTVTNLIGAGYSRDQSAIYTVPVGLVGYVTQALSTMTRESVPTSTALVRLMAREGIDTPNPIQNVRGVLGMSADGSSASALSARIPVRVVGPADVWLRCVDVSANDVRLTGLLGLTIGPT